LGHKVANLENNFHTNHTANFATPAHTIEDAIVIGKSAIISHIMLTVVSLKSRNQIHFISLNISQAFHLL
jgi:hypothetical protein